MLLPLRLHHALTASLSEAMPSRYTSVLDEKPPSRTLRPHGRRCDARWLCRTQAMISSRAYFRNGHFFPEEAGHVFGTDSCFYRDTNSTSPQAVTPSQKSDLASVLRVFRWLDGTVCCRPNQPAQADETSRVESFLSVLYMEPFNFFTRALCELVSRE